MIVGWVAEFSSLFSYKAGLHFLVLVAIVIGFFHGWLKLNYRSPITTFLFDAVLSLALVVCILTLPRGASFFPRLPLCRAILTFYVVVAAWALLPSDLPLVVRLASLRGWCFPPLILGLGYHLTRSIHQAKGFFVVLIALGVITGVYGIRQSPDEIRRKMQEDAFFAARYVGASYATDTGKGAVRRFSTFVTAGVFGGVMAFVSSIALVMLADASTKVTQKILLGSALVVMCYGIVLSGSRSPAVNMLLTMCLIAIGRRNFLVPILVVGVGYFVLSWASELTGGASMDRYATLVDQEQVGGRFTVPIRSAIGRLQESMLGTGLGTCGYSVPFFMGASLQPSMFRPAEGDLSALAVEMGVVGILVFGRVLWEICRTTYKAIRDSAGKQQGVVALAVATAVAPTVLNFPVGSPFLGIPTGALTWFFIGCMVKLNELDAAAPALTPSPPANIPTRPQKRFLYWQPNR